MCRRHRLPGTERAIAPLNGGKVHNRASTTPRETSSRRRMFVGRAPQLKRQQNRCPYSYLGHRDIQRPDRPKSRRRLPPAMTSLRKSETPRQQEFVARPEPFAAYRLEQNNLSTSIPVPILLLRSRRDPLERPGSNWRGQ